MLATLLTAVFVTLTGIGIIAPVMPIYATNLGATGLTLGLMIAAFSVSRGILQPFVGGLSDRHGKKRFLIVGLIIYAMAGLSYSFANSIGQLIIIRTIHGIGSAMVVPIAMAYIGDLAPAHEEGRYMGMLNIALFAGIGSGPIIGGLFLDSLGMNSAFYAMASLSALSVILVVVFLPPQETVEHRNLPPILSTLKKMMRNGHVIGILLARMATMIIMIPTLGFLPLLMNKFMDSSGIEIGLVIASRTLVNSILQTPFGRFADRHNKTVILVVGCGVITIIMFVVPFARSLVLLMVLFAILGTGEAMAWPTLGALAVEEGHTYGQGSMMGVFNMAMSAGIFIGSLGAGSMTQAFGISYSFYSVAVLLALLTTAAAVLIKGPKGAPMEEQKTAESV